MASIERSIEYSLADQTVRGAGSYEEACARHVWKIPSRYNIALDICDRHAGAGRRALVWEGPEGPGETYTFDDLKRLSNRLASGLRSLGVRRGDRVALMLPQTPEHALAHIAILKLGAISVPLSRLFGLDALRYSLADSGACVLLVFKGRADDMINSAGFRIGPAEVEGCLLGHPAVEQCAVIGVPDPVRGEAVKAFVLLKTQYQPSPDLGAEMREHVRQRLGAFQRPREIEWVNELPMTVSGKIKRAELRARAIPEGGHA